MLRTARPALALAAVALVAACGSPAPQPGAAPSGPTTTASTTPAESPSASASAAGHDWGYEGEHGPDHWGELPGAATCASGKAQSPVDLTEARPAELENHRFDYRPGTLAVVDLGHTAQMLPGGDDGLTLDGRRYDLAQIHHHTPSEHTLDGDHLPAELHLVHRDRKGDLAVLGVLFQEGAANPAVQQFLDAVPETTGATATAPGVTFDPSALLPADRRTYRYSGSLTTPPCTEGVAWSVFTTPVTASKAQIAALEGLAGKNNRPTQRLEGRTVQQDTSPD